MAKTKQYQIIIGGDFNAHSHSQGSLNENSRGDEIAEFLSKMDLEILNQGSKPIFKRINFETIIDVTVASRFIANKISEWKVLPEFTGSDHNYITYKIEYNSTMILKIRNPRNTDWNNFTKVFEEMFNKMDKRLTSKNSFDRIADDIELAFKYSYEKSCKETVVRTIRNVPWWNSDL